MFSERCACIWHGVKKLFNLFFKKFIKKSAPVVNLTVELSDTIGIEDAAN